MKKDECVITVEDDGKGLSEEQKEKVFEKGYEKWDNSGSGLGLFLVKEIAESYGGNIEVSDSGLGSTRFEVKLHKP